MVHGTIRQGGWTVMNFYDICLIGILINIVFFATIFVADEAWKFKSIREYCLYIIDRDGEDDKESRRIRISILSSSNNFILCAFIIIACLPFISIILVFWKE